MKLSQTLLSAVAAATCAMAGGVASAATYDFGSLLSGPGAPTSPSFASLTVTEVGSDVLFSLNASGLDLFVGNAPYIGVMAVDGTYTGSVSNVSGGAPVSLANGGGPGGSFDFRFDLSQGQNRLIDNELVSWTWAGGVGNYSSFALHVQGISYGRTTSAWYASSPVPEPGTYAMLLAGLGVIGVVARRRKQQS